MYEGPYAVEEAGAKWAVTGCRRRLAVCEERHVAELFATMPDLLVALKELVEDIPYAGTDTDCECGAFEESGVCPHTRARAAMVKVRTQS